MRACVFGTGWKSLTPGGHRGSETEREIRCGPSQGEQPAAGLRKDVRAGGRMGYGPFHREQRVTVH